MTSNATNDTQQPAEEATAQDATPQEAETKENVHFDGDFDAERAKTLIANLRGDLADVKEKYKAKDTEFAALKAELDTANKRYADVEGKFKDLTTLREKEAVLDKAGLTRDLANVLQGDKGDWKKTIDLLKAATAQKNPLKPDPAQQQATPPKPSDDDIARALFGIAN